MSDQTIFRVACRDKPYSQLGNAMMRDLRLSPEATGVLVFILSYPTDWQFNLTWLQKTRGIGKDRAQRIIREHVKLGYCQRRRIRGERGRLAAYEYLFTDEPQKDASANISPQPENPAVVKPQQSTTAAFASAGSPGTGQPALANPPLQRKKDNKENNEERGARMKSYLGDEWELPAEWHAWSTKESSAHAHMIPNDVKRFKLHYAEHSRNDWERAWKKWWTGTIGRPPTKQSAVVVLGHKEGPSGVRNTHIPFFEEYPELKMAAKD